MSEQKRQAQSRHEFEATLIARAWQDETFKQELISNPKAVYTRELGQQIPDSLTIQVIEETPSTLYLVIPRNPASAQVTEELSDQALEAVAGGEAQPNAIVAISVVVI
jgi:hypothetical protein